MANSKLAPRMLTSPEEFRRLMEQAYKPQPNAAITPSDAFARLVNLPLLSPSYERTRLAGCFESYPLLTRPTRAIKVDGTFAFPQEKNEMKEHYKLVILYDNGKSFTLSGVYKHELNYSNDKLFYTQYNKKTKVIIRAEVPMKDIAAITVKKKDSLEVKRYKPCAVIKATIYKR